MENHELLYLKVSEDKTKQLLKREGKRLLMIHLLINIFCKLIFSLNFMTEVFLNKGLDKNFEIEVHNSKRFFL